MTANASKSRTRRSASVLVLTLVVVVLLTLAAMAFFQRMFLELHATRTHERQLQARHFAESGVEFFKFMLSKDRNALRQEGGVYMNPTLLKGQLVLDDPQAAFRGRFTLLAPDMTTDALYSGIRYGAVENESSRLNLNTLLLADAAIPDAGRTLLLNLPGMTEPIADAILDWMDTDDQPRAMGAEQNEYSTGGYSYGPRNGPLHSIDELLLVRDVTPALLYGADLDHDGVVQEMERPLASIDGVNNDTGTLDRGWSAYLTLDSAERNVRPDGTAKIDVNMEDLQTLYSLLVTFLSPEQANFVIAFRQGGVEKPTTTTSTSTTGTSTTGGSTTGGSTTGGGTTTGGSTGGSTSGGSTTGGGRTTGGGATGGGTTGGGSSSTGTTGGATGGNTSGGGTTGGGSTNPVSPASLQIDYETPGRKKLVSILDLIGATASVVQVNQTAETFVQNPFTEDVSVMQSYVPLLMENLAVNANPTIPGRLNINQAARVLLMGIPEMDADLLEQIIANRDVSLGEQQQAPIYETWLLTDGYVDLAKMKQLLPLITSGGDVYRVRAVGFFDAGGPISRIEAIIDATKRPAVVLRSWEVGSLGQDATAYSAETLGGLPDNAP